MKQKKLFDDAKPAPETVTRQHVCTVCGAKWECASRSCWQNEKTICHQCPSGLPECFLMEKKDA
jgi:hypothetical protein